VATVEEYRGCSVKWLETGEQFVALVEPLDGSDRWMPITATVAEGMKVLKDRTRKRIDDWRHGSVR
jgi:hypothetical protein